MRKQYEVLEAGKGCVFYLLSRVLLLAIPCTVASSAPLSMGFFRQEHWSGLPFPSPKGTIERKKVKSLSRVRLSDPMDCSPPGSSVHGILQARTLGWVAVTSFRGSSWPRDRTRVSCISGRRGSSLKAGDYSQ